MKLSKPEREELRMMFGGFCAYCGAELPEKGWHVDHVKAVLYDSEYRPSALINGVYRASGFVKTGKLRYPENDNKDNLFPSCLACNINKSDMPLETWRKFLADGPESLASYNGRFRHMLRFKVVVVNPEPLLFWFEKFKAQASTPAPFAR